MSVQQQNKTRLCAKKDEPPDLNELMLKCFLDLNKSKRQHSENSEAKEAVSHRDLNNNFDSLADELKSSRTSILNRSKSLLGHLAKNDIEFFCSNNFSTDNICSASVVASNENWANFDQLDEQKTNESSSLSSLAILSEKQSYFEVWHRFFIALKELYKQIYDLFVEQEAKNNRVFSHTKIQEYLEYVNQYVQILQGIDETYNVYRRVLGSSNKFVNKKQSHLDNNLKHEIDRYYSNLNRLLCRTNKINSSMFRPLTTIEFDFARSKTNEILCSFCLHRVNLALDHLLFKSKYYHSNCINFWLNAVDCTSLPDLKLNLATTLK